MAYTSLKLRAEPVAELRRLTRRVAAEADRNVTQSDVLALMVAIADPSELAARIRRAEGAE
jgi:hypothetical protein